MRIACLWLTYAHHISSAYGTASRVTKVHPHELPITSESRSHRCTNIDNDETIKMMEENVDLIVMAKYMLVKGPVEARSLLSKVQFRGLFRSVQTIVRQLP